MKSKKFLLIFVAIFCFFTTIMLTSCGDKTEIIPVNLTVQDGYNTTFDISNGDESVMTLPNGSTLLGSLTYGGWLIKNGEDFVATVHVNPWYIDDSKKDSVVYGYYKDYYESGQEEITIIIRHLDSEYDSENLTVMLNGTKIEQTNREVSSEKYWTNNLSDVWCETWFSCPLIADLPYEEFDIQISGLNRKA